jgi:hypothetical protein
MVVVIGLNVLLVAVVAGPNNAVIAHALTDDVMVFGSCRETAFPSREGDDLADRHQHLESWRGFCMFTPRSPTKGTHDEHW